MSLIPMIVSFVLGKIGAFAVAGALAIASVILIIRLFTSGARRFNEI
ncbi:MAG: hypothetical protein IKX41_00890 [Oscillospiraceae bacterium]|nr:hypothetical protein [Oscillospiraceae bacterium]